MKTLFVLFLTGILLTMSYQCFTQYFPFHNPVLFAVLSFVVTSCVLVLILQLGRSWTSLQKRRLGVLLQRGIATGIDLVLIIIVGALLLFLCGGGYSLISHDRQIYVPPVLVVIIAVVVSLMFLARDTAGIFFSVGKRLLGLHIIRVEDWQPCTIRESMVRNSLLYVYGLTAFLSADPQRPRPSIFEAAALLMLLLIVADVLRALRTPDLQTWLERVSKTRTVKK